MGARAVDPALTNTSGDPERKLGDAFHAAEITPVYAGEATHQNAYLDDKTVPTDEELRTLRRVSGRVPWLVLTVAFVELLERMSYYGTIAVFTNFIQKPNPGTSTGAPPDPNDAEAQPGALGLGQQASTSIGTFNKFWIYLMPLFGAYIADTYLGRFKTIIYSVIVAEIGHVILTASATPDVMDAPRTSLGIFILGLIIMGVGTGFFKPNIAPLIAEQVPQEVIHVMTTKKGERVIVDPAIAVSKVFHWFYLFLNIGALVGQIGMVYAERYVGFYLSFLLPTIMFLFAFPVLLFCRKRYIRRPPEGSVLAPAVKLLLLALRGRWHLNPVATWKHWHDGTFWESIKVPNPMSLLSVQKTYCELALSSGTKPASMDELR
jgi:POT family proton-dependent oligopeptide transporter